MNQDERSYPPGANRRVIDWVRGVAARKCNICGCEEPARVMSMDEDAWCLGHYLPLPTCSVTGCHRPALRIGCRKEYGDGDLCREHQYETPAMREQIMEQDAMLVVRSSHYGHADF